MGKKSLQLGYVRDAIRYLQQAHEQSPDDADTMLALGWAYNLAKDDSAALVWFNRARRADDPSIAAEASKAFHNLRGDPVPQTTIWTMPMFSTRWHDVFSYGQIKHTFPMPWLGVADHLVSFYLSTRFDGDLKGSVPNQLLAPQYLSTSSIIFAGGVSSKTWHHFTGWAEAGAKHQLPSLAP